ncbi:STAS domain-containing protein [Actinomadura opuntiae]|uniref:STAS domain-containing protein n=1 Tax=Actinomadura sp. OS1-43 TaxID=604315 RepID=UPI00255A7E34|nr:STAS domain-containing protein [Actinomadura sp. OS1-43]MDL4813102.1 STAS domain-containing protein [Actinomadura sp. OS1-43]
MTQSLTAPRDDDAMSPAAPHCLGITTSHRGDTIMMLLTGELDMAADDRLRAAVGTALTDRPRTLVVEMSGLQFLDCTGLSILIWTRNQLHRHGGTLQIRNPRPNIRRVLDLGDLTPHIV